MVITRGIQKFSFWLIICALTLIISCFFCCDATSYLSDYSFLDKWQLFENIYASAKLSRISALVLLLISPSMYLALERRYPLDTGYNLLFFCYILIFSCKGALCMSSVHVAAYFLVWALYFSFRSSMETYNPDNPFISALLLSISSLFFAPLIWLAPIMIALDRNLSFVKDKCLVGSILGLTLPMILVVGISAIKSGYQTVFQPLFEYLRMAVSLDYGVEQIKIASLVKLVLLAIIIIRSIIFFLNSSHRFNAVAAKCYMRCLIYSICLAIIAFLFGHSITSIIWVLPLLPLSLLIFAYFNANIDKKTCSFLMAIFLIISIAERAILMI